MCSMRQCKIYLTSIQICNVKLTLELTSHQICSSDISHQGLDSDSIKHTLFIIFLCDISYGSFEVLILIGQNVIIYCYKLPSTKQAHILYMWFS